MGILDGLNQTTPDIAPQIKPESGSSRDGFFDWKNPKHAQNEQAIGVILPPYKEWISERIAAAQQGKPFNTPFALAHGKHAVGGKTGKVYVECQQTLLRKNKVGDSYPLLHPDVVAAGDNCSMCDVCWNEIWPAVEQWKGREESAEYKAYKAAHRMACPQEKYLVNWLPAGSTTPVLLDLAQTAYQQIEAIQFDPRQPDLLWPYSPNQQWQTAWVQLSRKIETHKTTYSILTAYIGTPHVLNQQRQFDQDLYLRILETMKDLRAYSRTLMDPPAEMQKAMVKLASSVSVSLSINQGVQARIEQATAPMVPVGGVSVTPPVMPPAPPMAPPMAPMGSPMAPMGSPMAPAAPVAAPMAPMAPGAPMAPAAPVAAPMAPMMAPMAPGAPMAPAAPVAAPMAPMMAPGAPSVAQPRRPGDADQAMDELQNLLNPRK